ncbi:hypothetical protein, partial [Klebsiella oxytoca]|uniref:hypothetical protein n=1 Tax=Klebsiella oxytoca TaxID=571 RepID=UPI001CCBA1BA
QFSFAHRFTVLCHSDRSFQPALTFYFSLSSSTRFSSELTTLALTGKSPVGFFTARVKQG